MTFLISHQIQGRRVFLICEVLKAHSTACQRSHPESPKTVGEC